jgi:hypothetical protein
MNKEKIELNHRLAEAILMLQTKHKMARSEEFQARTKVLEVELCKIRSTVFQKEGLLIKVVGMLREEVALHRSALVRRDEILAEKNICFVGLEKQIVEERCVARDSHERVSALYSKENWNGIIKTRQLMDTRRELETVIKSKTPKQRQEIFAARLFVTKFKNSAFTKECLRNMASLATQLKAFHIEMVEREERCQQSELSEWLDCQHHAFESRPKARRTSHYRHRRVARGAKASGAFIWCAWAGGEHSAAQHRTPSSCHLVLRQHQRGARLGELGEDGGAGEAEESHRGGRPTQALFQTASASKHFGEL